MKIVVIGDGKVGRTIIEHMSREKHEVIVIDNNPKVIEQIVDMYDVMGVCGSGTSYETLKEAMDAIFVSEVMAEVRKLKICRYCDKPFFAVNPKAEYDTPACKNKANVYKFRSKEKRNVQIDV